MCTVSAVVVGAVAAVMVGAGPASAADNGLAPTPVMGFNDWNAFGCNVSATLIEQTADLFVSDGLKAAGYNYVDIDDCWMTKTRDSGGHLVADPTKFPNGIKAVADYVHAKGLKLGIYESAGLTTCQKYPGSLGHETTDADDFAKWGVDLLKYDNCGTTADTSTTQAQYIARYTAMANALSASGRKIVYSICEWGNFEPWTWAPTISNQWRTTGDITDNYASMLNIVKQNAALASYAKPGAFNDPDMLEIGNGGMTDAEYRSEFSLWSMMAAPLIAGTDLRSATPATLAIYKNTDVIALDQDSLGKQAALISSANGLDVFAKPLANGDTAVALFNENSSAATISTSAATVGATSRYGVYSVKDLWSKATTESDGAISAFVPGHSTVVYRITAANDLRTAARVVTGTPAQTALSINDSTTTVPSAGSIRVTVTLTNDATLPIRAAQLGLTAPSGWSVTPIRERHGRWGRGSAVTRSRNGTVSQAFEVRAPQASSAMATADLTAHATYRDVAGEHSVTSVSSLTEYAPVTAPNKTADTTAASALEGQFGSNLAISAAGAGVQAAATSPFGNTTAADQYGAIYRAGAAGQTSTTQVTVTAQAGPTGRGTHGAAGIMVRNDMTATTDKSEGVVLDLSSSGSVQLSWAANGGTTVDTTLGGAFGSPTVAVPVMLRLVRNGTSYVGSYSTDAGNTWVTVGTATLPSANTNQDAGVYHTSGSTTATEADFTGLTIS